ncbi:MAG: NAD(P)H-hydrate dehydratase [Gudongella sp.]|nr:NAD(P)H-hydrate dehydratase [Gudongella sp.]
MNVRTGIDIIKNVRIEKIIQKNKESFYNRIFTTDEQEYIKDKNDNIGTIAGLFAAKEAVSKLMGTGIGQLSWKDIITKHDLLGRPYIDLSDNGKVITKKLGIANIDISISNEDDYSVAIAIGEQNKKYVIQENMPYRLKKRTLESHKGDYGRIGIIGGSPGMLGSVYLSSYGALRSGAGLVYAILQKELARDLNIKATELITKEADELSVYKKALKGLDSLVIGPGFGTGKLQREIVEDCILNFTNPIVIDADALNILANNKEILKNRKYITIITPHLGEMSRLFDTTIDEIQNNKESYAKKFSNEYGAITILKGHQTIVTDGDRLYINHTGNPGMATAGSGDVLAGITGSFLTQFRDPYEACVLAVYVHGLAGDIARDKKGEYGMIASDIIDSLAGATVYVVED